MGNTPRTREQTTGTAFLGCKIGDMESLLSPILASVTFRASVSGVQVKVCWF